METSPSVSDAEQPVAKLPLTEAGLQTALTHLGHSRQTGDRAGEAYSLLALGHLVKWVRSDNEQPPFERSHTVSQEALTIFRELNNKRGILRALRASVPFATPQEKSAILAEALDLARELGDPVQLAHTLATQGRTQRDPVASEALTREALAIYRSTGHSEGIAQCLFGLSIREKNPEVKVEMLIESFDLFGQAGNRKQMAHAGLYAAMIADGHKLPDLKWRLLLVADNANADGNPSEQASAYRHLARIATLEGDTESAGRYLRWCLDLDEADGLTPAERRKNEREFLDQLSELAKRTGNTEFETTLRNQKKGLGKR